MPGIGITPPPIPTQYDPNWRSQPNLTIVQKLIYQSFSQDLAFYSNKVIDTALAAQITSAFRQVSSQNYTSILIAASTVAIAPKISANMEIL